MFRKSLIALGLVSLVAALASRVVFSTGALEFEGTGRHGEPKPRWLGQHATIPVYGSQTLWLFKAQVLTGVGRVRLAGPGLASVALDVARGDQPYLPMQSMHSLWPTRYAVTFDRTYDTWQRQLSGQLIYPPIFVSLPLLMTRGAGEPEPAPDGAALRCEADCTFAVLHAGNAPTSVLVTVVPAVPDSESSIEVTAAVNSDPQAPASLDAPPPPAALVSLKVDPVAAGGTSTAARTEVPADSRWYTLRVRMTPAPHAGPGPAMRVVVATR